MRYRSSLRCGLVVGLLFFALNLAGCGGTEQTVLETPVRSETTTAVAGLLNESESLLDTSTALTVTGDTETVSFSPKTGESAEHVHFSSIATLDLVRAADGRTLLVRIDNVRDLYAVDMTIRFDATKGQVADADAQTSGVQIKPGEAPRPDFVVVNSVDNREGIIRYVATQLGNADAFNGSGAIATILWQTGVDLDANISVETVTLVDKHAQAIEVAVR